MSRVVTVADYSITSLSGSSQSLLAKDGTRSYLLIQNTGNANVGVNLAGGTAAIGGTGTITLVPNGSLTFNIDSIPANAINVIGTAGQPLVCLASP